MKERKEIAKTMLDLFIRSYGLECDGTIKVATVYDTFMKTPSVLTYQKFIECCFTEKQKLELEEGE